MGLFKKPVNMAENDEDIKREIRARVARQAGIYDEEYVRTGVIGGENKSGGNASSEPSVVVPKSQQAAPVTFVEVPEPQQAAPVTFVEVPEPEQATSATEVANAQKLTKTPKSAKAPKPAKEPKPAKAPKPAKKTKPAKKSKKINVLLIIMLLVLALAFIPLYNMLTNSDSVVPELSMPDTPTTLLLSEDMEVSGMVASSKELAGISIYYTLDAGTPVRIHSLEGEVGYWEGIIALPETNDFLGEHTITFYAENLEGEASTAVVRTFTVVAPALTGIKITTLPDENKYQVGDALDLSGLEVTGTYEDGSSVVIEDYTTSIEDGTKLTKAGEFTVIVSFTADDVEKKAEWTYTVEKVEEEPTPPTPPTPPSRQVDGSLPVPSIEVFKAGAGTADVVWDAVGGISGYEIQRKKGSSGSWSTVKTLSNAYTSWTDSGPSSGSTYYYRISSYVVRNGVKVFSNYDYSSGVAL